MIIKIMLIGGILHSINIPLNMDKCIFHGYIYLEFPSVRMMTACFEVGKAKYLLSISV